jgi:drug/metabolite transporter (DMT)-like permease
MLILASGFLLASHDGLSKYLTQIYPVFFIVWARYLAQTVMMTVMFAPRMGKRLITTQRPKLQAARAMCLVGVSVFIFSALMFIPLGEATAVIFLSPVVVILISALVLKEKISPSVWVSVAGGLLGVMIIVRPGGDLFTPAILLPVAAAICFGTYHVLTRRLSGIDHPVASNYISSIIGTLVMSAFLPWVWVVPSWEHIFAIVSLAALAMCGHLCLTSAYHHASAATLAPFTYAQIIFAALLGMLIFGHVPDWGGMLGMAVIIISGVSLVVNKAQARRKAKEHG